MQHYIDVNHVSTRLESSAERVIAFMPHNTPFKIVSENVAFVDDAFYLMIIGEFDGVENLDSKFPKYFNFLLSELRKHSLVFVYSDPEIRDKIDEIKNHLIKIIENEDKACLDVDPASPVCNFSLNDI